MRRKSELDHLISSETGIPVRTVSRVTGAWTDVIREVLLQDGNVYLQNFGRLTVHLRRGGKHRLVQGNFKKGHRSKIKVVDVPIQRVVHFKKAKLLADELARRYVLPADDDSTDQGETNGKAGRRRAKR